MTTFSQIMDAIRRALQWWIIIAPWEQGIRVRMGKHVTRLEPGVHLRLPLVHAVYRQSVRMRWCDLPTQTIATADGKTVTLSVTLGYQVDDIERLYTTLHHAEATLRNMTLSAVAAAIHGMDAECCTPRAVEEHATDALDFAAYGVGEVRIRATDFAFVRTYRLIQDQRWVTAGDDLDTTQPADREAT